MVIQHNIMSIFAYSANRRTVGALKEHLEKLSSGYRINRSADDAAGLAVSERIRAKVTELDRCQRNAAEGMDLARTADAALAEVSDMLKRARSLCIQAENGTYSSQELASISGEMNQLFSEIERIAKGSCFNTIRLFQGQVPGFEPPFHYEYDEVFSPAGDALQIWGNMSFIKEEDFDVAEKAKAATAVIKLDEGIDFNDVKSLNGRSIIVGSDTFYFTDGSVQPPGGSTSYNHSININTYNTPDRALGQLASLIYRNTSVAGSVYNSNNHTITLTATLRTLNAGDLEVDGMTLPNTVANGDGAWANGSIAARTPAGGASLDSVDQPGIGDNVVEYSSTATASIRMRGAATAKLTDTQVKNLKGNRLEIGGNIIHFKDLASPPSTSMTWADFGQALAAKISSLTNYSATYDSGTNYVQITRSGLSGSSSGGSIYEYVTPDSGVHTESKTLWTSGSLGLTATVTTPASGERPEMVEVTVPAIPTDQPFAFTINNSTYLFYDSSRESLSETGYTTSYSPNNTTPINIHGMSQEQILNRIASYLRSSSGARTAEVKDGKVILTAASLNNSMNLRVGGAVVTLTGTKRIVDTPGTDHVFSSGAVATFQKTAAIPFHLGASLDLERLAGSGFSVGGYKYEFVNGAGTGLRTDYTDIDISRCTSFEDLRAAVQQAFPSYGGYSATIDDTNPNDVKLKINLNTSGSISVTDGATGTKGLIAGGGSVQYSGGTNTGFSQKAIDFSSIQTRQDLEALLGKGFRINCATCSGEYINVFFCWKKSDDIPLSFERPDPETGLIRTIHNIPVELSKISNGRSIVRSIVDQVAPTLKHFTNVAVGNSPTTLLAQDKRIGDVVVGGALKLGKVLSGVEANFTYSVGFRKVLDNPEDADEVVVQDSEVKIYVGSDPKAQFIPIHLPHLDLQTLKLGPEGGVDLTDPGQSASDWLARVDRADLAISNARGTIGADYNRLEHAIQDLSNSHIQLSDALSVIRDADMAQLMMAQVKDQILLQAQQSMMVQANQSAQGVLQLMH